MVLVPVIARKIQPKDLLAGIGPGRFAAALAEQGGQVSNWPTESIRE